MSTEGRRSADAPALELREVVKRFGATPALDGASLVVRRGTVHALLGENGAGKTTLMRVAFGLVRPDRGTVLVSGEARRLVSPREAIAAGLGMVHQHFTLVPAMTVAENVALGGRGRFDAERAAERVRALVAETGLAVDPVASVGALGVGAQQRVEILKALSREARVLILDEPTAVLAPAEAEALLGWIRRFAAAGRSVVLITHKLREALAVADDVTVLRRGRTVLSGSARGVSEEGLAAAMLGGEGEDGLGDEMIVVAGGGYDTGAVRALDSTAGGAPHAGRAEPPPPSPAPILRLRDVTLADPRGVPVLTDLSLDVMPAEILGVAAVEGAGQRELLRALAGRLAPLRGTVEAPGEVGFVPENRQRDALVLDFSLTENVALRGAARARGRMRWRELERRTDELLRAHDVRASGPRAPARALSGGNQQKLVLGRELAGAPRALVVENPTQGLDIRAAAAVHQRLRQAAAGGTAVVLHSSDLDEVIALAGRVVVLFGGRARILPPRRELVGRAMLGVAD